MPALRRARYTIGQYMVLVAALAVSFGLSRFVLTGTPNQLRLAISFAAFLSVLVFIFLGTGFLVELLVRSMLGRQCPVCSRWTLQRLARHHRYFECPECAARVKQSWLGRWHDASGPGDAPAYESRRSTRPWQGFAVSSATRDTTVGRLLSNQRERRPMPVPPDDSPGDAAS